MSLYTLYGWYGGRVYTLYGWYGGWVQSVCTEAAAEVYGGCGVLFVLDDDTVTVRERDSTEQASVCNECTLKGERVHVAEAHEDRRPVRLPGQGDRRFLSARSKAMTCGPGTKCTGKEGLAFDFAACASAA
eukprot:403243-Rhodomonas_salina.1